MARIAVIEREKIKDKKEWFRLISGVCPVNRVGKECVYMKDGEFGINEELCVGCGICVKRDPWQSIQIINLPEELKEEPIHRYGVNGFRIFRFPTPRFNSVVGLVGKNGIGKSTILQILAGITKPNLGKDSASYEEFIDYLKGTEAQAYFEKLKDKEIKVSFKPQRVDEIPKLFSGTVRSLLEKSNETKKLKEVIKELDLENILDRDIKDISGGELQRVAIAACVLKKANLYIIDEPTSYLDIKQRLNVAQFIKNLVNETTGVIVVEHDLLIMDYMADHIHIVYGQPALYGIISQPKSIRNGINAYLEGMLKEENIRWRQHAEDERAHYAKDAWDIEYNTPWGGWKEMAGVHNRGDWDLSRHSQYSGVDLSYTDDETKEKFVPYIVETSDGADRATLMFLVDAYTEVETRSGDEDAKHEKEVVLRLHKYLAPIKVAILPLSKKEPLQKLAKEIQGGLRQELMTQYDETGSIGKRYRRQDEIGTPYCITVDFDSLEDKKVTVRDRDSMQQERIEILELNNYLRERFKE